MSGETQTVKEIDTMKKVVFGSSLFIGGMLSLMIVSMPYWWFAHLTRYTFFNFLFSILPFAIMAIGLFVGIKGLKEKE